MHLDFINVYSEESPGRVLPPLCFLNQIDGSTLRTLCLQHGPLITFHLNLTQGNAVVRYSSKEEAAKAQKSLHMYVPPLPRAALAAARWCGGWALWVGPGAAATEHRGRAGWWAGSPMWCGQDRLPPGPLSLACTQLPSPVSSSLSA